MKLTKTINNFSKLFIVALRCISWCVLESVAPYKYDSVGSRMTTSLSFALCRLIPILQAHTKLQESLTSLNNCYSDVAVSGEDIRRRFGTFEYDFPYAIFQVSSVICETPSLWSENTSHMDTAHRGWRSARHLAECEGIFTRETSWRLSHDWDSDLGVLVGAIPGLLHTSSLWIAFTESLVNSLIGRAIIRRRIIHKPHSISANVAHLQPLTGTFQYHTILLTSWVGYPPACELYPFPLAMWPNAWSLNASCHHTQVWTNSSSPPLLPLSVGSV